MFFYSFIFMATLALSQSTTQLSWLNDKKPHSFKYCVVSEENNSTAVALFNNNKPVKSFKHQLHSYNSIKKNIFCDISINKECKDVLDGRNVWKYDISDNYDLPPILDRRWEDLSIIQTGVINFVNIYNITKPENKLELKLRVKIEKNAHIYLCDGIEPLNANCYWFVIGGWGENNNSRMSIARECKKSDLRKSFIEGKFGQGGESCSKHPENETIPHKREHITPPTSSNNWTDLVIEKTNKLYSVKIRNETITAPERVLKIVVKHIFIASPSNNPGEWEFDKKSYETGQLYKIQLPENKRSVLFSFSLYRLENTYKPFIYLCKEAQKDSLCYSLDLVNDTWKVNETRNGKNCGEISTDIPNALTNYTSWQHFILKKDSNSYKLINNEKIVLQFNATQNIDDIKYVYFASRKTETSYWKYHRYGIFVGKKSGDTSLDFIKGAKGQRICVALFVNVCRKCKLTFQITDGKGKSLISEQRSNSSSWEEIKLETTLNTDVDTKLKISLQEATENEPAFIGDISDCTKNLRIIKTNYNESNTTCSLLKSPEIKANKIEDIITVPGLNDNIIDTVWFPNSSTCKQDPPKKDLEKLLNCSIRDSNFKNFIKGEDVCFLSFTKTMFNSKYICEVSSTMELTNLGHNYNIFLIFIPIIILCACLGSVVYLYKKPNRTNSSSWIYFIPRAYNYFISELLVTNRHPESETLPLNDDKNSMFSNLMKLEDFQRYVNEESSMEEILTQYNEVDNLNLLPRTVGSMEKNICKNRYKNIIAYDSTRVSLDSPYSNNEDSYINANFIKGYKNDKAYIATQGPMPKTIHDFWRMIWQENVRCIVMLTPLIEEERIKCHKYWPDQTETYDEFIVTCINTEFLREDLIQRSLTVNFNNVERKITQIHYEGWADFEAPESKETIQQILSLMNGYEKQGSPIVVHCSAGVGRTGSLILCDIAIKMARETQTVDVLSILYQLRQQRMNMVQTIDQYKYVHKSIAFILETI